jgi:hypothetical protein
LQVRQLHRDLGEAENLAEKEEGQDIYHAPKKEKETEKENYRV